MKSKRLLLLNPPGRRLYTRDYFCSKVTKSGHIEHPVDLLILSGVLNEHYSLNVIDAIAQGMDFDTSLKEILRFDPDTIIFLAGCVSFQDDFAFLKKIKEACPHVTMIGIGDIFKDVRAFQQNPWINAYLRDFTSPDILEYLEGRRSGLTQMAYRDNGSITLPAKEENKISKTPYQIPIPRHELFLGKNYTYPFVRHLPYTTVLTDYGCGFNCSYCVYSSFGFKMRSLENVFRELEYIHSLGIQELFIKDQTFAFDRRRGIALCQEMIRQQWHFSWICFLRANVVNTELLTLMKEAGCHTAIFGVESGNEEILNIYRKGVHNKEKIKATFKECRRLGIQTVATFILGLPEDNEQTIQQTIDFAKELGCDYASFNTFVPKPGTPLENVRSGEMEMIDQSGMASVKSYGRLSPQRLDWYRRKAVFEFYLNPGYLARRFLRLKTITEMKMNIQNGLFLVHELLKRPT